ncbi:MAG: DNA replication/repair protein RecF [Gammaproteobacteria bacterium]|nr:DNA replication/repair protein RecF [Gammaproteobacteria bacterium]|tara:strand:- start:212 stop:1324 length:1113 start_codon:yes stop_codon:yes gene_type:complete
MPKIITLKLSGLRNLDSAKLEFSPGFNLIYGENGSGKTSLLEAVYLLGRAKSFRSSSRAPLIQLGLDECVIHADLDDKTGIGFSRSTDGEQHAKINANKIKNQAELAARLPIQLLNSDTFKIIEGGPGVRRSFLDWGVFHVEHQFIQSWQQMQRALSNRNSLLKEKNISPDQIAPWTLEFCRHAEEVHVFRQAYVESLLPVLQQALNLLLPEAGIDLVYEKGWDEESALGKVLEERLDQDRRYGHTSYGPHRADLKISSRGSPAAELLSRGQEKLLVLALKLSQAELYTEETGRKCLFLIDDLPAELDASNRAKILSLLEQSGEQVFVTGIELNQLLKALKNCKEMRLFHVKHGKITPENITADIASDKG